MIYITYKELTLFLFNGIESTESNKIYITYKELTHSLKSLLRVVFI